jgi:hypothetical protein
MQPESAKADGAGRGMMHGMSGCAPAMSHVNQEPRTNQLPHEPSLCAMTRNEPVSLCPHVTCPLEPRRQVAYPAAP